MYILHLLLALLAGVSPPSVHSGNAPDPDVLSCYADAANVDLYKQNAAYSRRTDSLESAWSKAASNLSQEKSAAAPPYVLPIVFHIVHENGSENIPDTDVQRSVDFLNQALANTDYYDPSTGANTQIQVCLAQRTPDNLATNGITRTTSPLTNLNTQDDLMLKDLSRWAPRDYINVWVVKEVSGLGLGNSLAGYAYYPGAHGGRVDGIVMEARWLARDEAAVGVLIHELGHYLGLRHTFDGGCTNDDCTINGDRVCDTPPDQSTVAVPCGGSANSCDTDTDSGFATDQDDMHINYMDYGFFRCYSAFTAGQRDRMHFFLDGIRRSLTESKGCLSPCPGLVTADYTGGDVTVQVGTTLNFSNTSNNGATFRWLEGATLLSTTANYSQTFNTVGTYRIKLVATPADPTLCLADSIERVIHVVCPVTSDFSFPTADYETGAVITFTNTSTGGGSSSWSVNGTQVVTDPDMTFTFAAPGRYQVCLQESNGLCGEERCRSLIVSAPPCDVRAAFIYSSNGFSVGGSVTFANVFSSGTTSTWTIDGTQVSTETNLTRTFPDLGSFEVCLRESNGICEREFCRVVVVPEEPCTGPDCPGNEGCSEGFTYLYGLPDSDAIEEVTAVLPDGDRFYLSVWDSRRLWVMAVREDGSILWQTEVFPDGNGSLITEMMIDDEGQLAAIGRTSTASNIGAYSFMVRINPNNGNLLWARSYQSEQVRPIFNRLFSQKNTGNYAIIGYTENTNSAITVFDRDGLFLTIDKADGSIATGPLHYQNNGILRFNSAAYDPDNGRYYVLGSIDGGASPGTLSNGTFLVVLDELGTPLTNRLYNLTQVGNSFPVGIVKEGDELVIAITAELNSSTSHNTYFLRTALNGDQKTARLLPNLTGPAKEMIANNQGYTLVGNSLFAPPPNQTDLIQLNRNGEVSWATTILDHFHFSSQRFLAMPQMINTHNNQVVLAGLHRPFREGTLLNLNSFGTPVAGCNDFERGAVTSEETDLRTSSLQFFAEPSQYFTNDFFSEPGGLAFNPESCALDCPGVDTTGNCGMPLQLNYSTEGGLPRQSFHQVIPMPDGYILGGTVDEQATVLRVNHDGEILWQRKFRGESSSLRKLIIDEDGFLAGLGRDGTDGEPSNPFVFKIALNDGTVQWTKSLRTEVGDFHLNEILHPGPGENYRCFGTYEVVGNAISNRRIGLMVEINNVDGSLPMGTTKLYIRDERIDFDAATIDTETGTYYVTGFFQAVAGSTGGANRTQGSNLLALNASGEVLWARQLWTDTGSQNDQGPFATDIELDNDLIVVSGWSQRDTSDSFFKELYTFNLAGEPLDRIEIYNHTAAINNLGYWPNKIVVNSAGYLIFNSDFNISDFSFNEQLTQISRNGTLLWSKNYRGPATGNGLKGEGLAMDGNNIILTHTNERSGGVFSVLRLGPNGEASTCVLEATQEAYTVKGEINSGPIDLEISRQPLFSIDEEWEAGALSQTIISCPGDCPSEEVCNNQIDDDEDGLVDCDDPDVADDCCCAALPTIDLGRDTSLCPGDFLVEGTDRRFVSYRWSTGATTDSIVIDVAGEYWLEVTDSCGNLASDTLTLHLRPRPLLDLGPDTTLCSNAIIPLLAQDGFATYEWVDGTSEKGFTGYGEGDFWVRATDSCGGVQTDTVRVKFDPATEINLGVDTLICPGDTLTFTLSGYTNYQWSESTFIDCINCPEVRFAPTSDTLLLVAAEFGGGCFSSDSIRIRIQPIIGNRDSVYLCPGDSTVFGNTTLFTSGQYLEVVEGINCERTDTLDVFLLRDTLILETFSICQGDSMLVFDRFESAAGTYERRYAAANGCDSTQAIELIVRQQAFTSATISICAGDSTLIFGNSERTPGEYRRVFPAANGCDSTHLITLEVDALNVSAEQLRPACGAAAGAGEVFFNQPTSAVSIRWPDGTDQAQNNDLAAGDYAVTVTTLAEGCTAIANLTIAAGRDLNLSAFVSPETCPGENDGVITAGPTDLNGLSFSLNGGPAISTPEFTNLSPNDYSLLVIDSLGCNQELLLTVEAASEVLLDLPATLSIVLGDSVTLLPQTNLPADTYTINWSSSLGDTCSACPSLILRPPTTVTVSAILTDINGCSATDQTVISVSEEDLFYLPNVFSPNGDGVNDEFRLFPGPGVEQILRFSIFDRWGGRAYHAEELSPTDALAAWDGRSPNGQLPSIGVYVYLIEVRLTNGEVVSQAGEVLLMR
ncbi:M43 family zinc metalloprotease [Neolewinella persica]|uniref:M43 family zinc metalloprotease n=1 Tax=Neolewinella persica TaxID=70998 RepID=UPI00036CFAEC|nr:M43 family zinc metalloprotease [Neolewinella persica]